MTFPGRGLPGFTSGAGLLTPGLPPGVALQPIDGGPSYYSGNGFTYAASAGWDSAAFYPVGAWNGAIVTQSDADRWVDLAWNTSFRTQSNTSQALLDSNGIWLINEGDGGTYGPPSISGAETTGIGAYDEPSTTPQWEAALQGVSNAIQDHRFWWLNNTWNFIAFNGVGSLTAAQTYAAQVVTPNGSLRSLSMQSCDTYWIAGATGSVMTHPLGVILGLGVDATADQCRRGCWYGDAVSWQRALVPGIPILQFVENGGPYNTDTTAASYITPAEMNWGVWSSLLHGARYICYFNNSFAGPGIGNDNLSRSYFQTVQSGQTVSVYAQTKSTDTLIAQLAPVLNSPFATGYVTVSPAASTFSGIDASARFVANGGPARYGTGLPWAGNGFYIFAVTRNSETVTNTSATFTAAGGYNGAVTAINADGGNSTYAATYTLTASGGMFTDTFPAASSVRIYFIPYG